MQAIAYDDENNYVDGVERGERKEYDKQELDSELRVQSSECSCGRNPYRFLLKEGYEVS